MIYLLLFIFSVIFVELFIRLNLLNDVSIIISVSKDAVALMSSEMGDDEKEAGIRTSSLNLFKATFSFIAKFASVFAVLYFLYVIIEQVSSSLGQAIISAAMSVNTLLLLTFVTLFYVWIRKVVLQKLYYS